MNNLPSIGGQGEARMNIEVNRKLDGYLDAWELSLNIFISKVTNDSLKKHIEKPVKQ